jgi:hypothetical protein
MPLDTNENLEKKINCFKENGSEIPIDKIFQLNLGLCLEEEMEDEEEYEGYWDEEL